MKIALGVEYDGSEFVGWQRQREGRTVQAELERALSQVADTEIKIFCAGRTDARVHACGQVAHFDTSAERPLKAWVLGSNSNLPRDVCVQWAQPMADSFHARFSAVARAYRYIICNRTTRPGLWARKMAFYYAPLDVSAMARGAQYLVGKHDFSAFRGAGCQASHPNRHVFGIDVRRHDDFVTLTIEANAFLLHMVRNIVGTLIPVGRGEKPPSWVGHVLNERDRAAAGMTAPPEGLYLESVQYPTQFNVPPSRGFVAPWMLG